MDDFTVNEGYFRTTSGILKARLTYETDPMDPWKDWDHLGTLVQNTSNSRGFSIGDEQTDSWSEFFYNDTPDLTEEDYENMTEVELYNKWKKSKFVVIPVSFYDYGSNGCSLSYGDNEDDLDMSLYDNSRYIENAGFYYVEKNDKEIAECNYTKETARNIMKGDLNIYKDYIEGNVYTLWWQYWNPETLDWDDEDNCGDIYLCKNVYQSEGLIEAIEDCCARVVEEIYEPQIKLMSITITPKYREYIYDELCSKIINCKGMFDGNIKYALRHVLSIWCKNIDYNRDKVLVNLFYDCITDFDKRAEVVNKLLRQYQLKLNNQGE